jgi:hypothetical protein
MNQDYAQVRQYLDGDEPFVTDGFQIVKDRREVRRHSEIFTWMSNDAEVKRFIFSIFPRCETSKYQRASARLWTTVIVLYFRMRLAASAVAAQINIGRNGERESIEYEDGLVTGELYEEVTPERIYRVAHSIRKAAAGERTDGKKRTGRRSGRPPKLIAGSVVDSVENKPFES